MHKDNYSPYRHTIVHYETCEDLNIGFLEYSILDAMLWKSKQNVYSETITFLSNYLWVGRTTIYEYIEKLVRAGHLDTYGKRKYLLHHDLKERLTRHKAGKKYLKIYHQLKEDYDLKTNDCCALYLIYSFSISKGGKSTPTYVKTYCTYLKVTERAFYNIRDRLLDKKLIYRGKYGLCVAPSIEKVFVHKVQDNDECSDSSG